MLKKIAVSPEGSHTAFAQALMRALVQVSPKEASQRSNSLHAQHENNKTALIFYSIGIGIALTLYKFLRNVNVCHLMCHQ